MPLPPESRTIVRWDIESSEGMLVLRRVLEERIRGGGSVDVATLHRSARLLCADAHAAGLRAEQLVVALKRAWSVLPDARSDQHMRSGLELLDRAITLCIAEFYALPAVTAAAAPPDSIAS